MSSWMILNKEEGAGTDGDGTDGISSALAGDRLVEELGTEDPSFQPTQEIAPLRKDSYPRTQPHEFHHSIAICGDEESNGEGLGLPFGCEEEMLKPDKELKEVDDEDSSGFHEGCYEGNAEEKLEPGYQGPVFEKEAVVDGHRFSVEGSGIDEYDVTNESMGTERSDEDMKSGYRGYCNPTGEAIVSSPNVAAKEQDSVILIESIQQSCPLDSSSLAIGGSCNSGNPFLTSFLANSLPTGAWPRHQNLNGSQKHPYMAEVSHLETLEQPSHNDYTNLMDPSNGNTYASHNSSLLARIDSAGQEHKNAAAEFSLQHVLSDSITGILMDDAMVAQCGHSFGINSLQCVIETNLCLSCGASVPLGSLIPNYALRAAVQAFKREEQHFLNPLKGTKRRRDQTEQPENSDGKRTSRAQIFSTENTIAGLSRPKGVQFPFVVNDRVLIKGNKRTPERFVGREAIITTQCLNGWYLVRTLDKGESVRLQYRSLQKVEDIETPTVLETENHAGHSGDTILGVEASKGQSSASVPTCLSDDVKEVGTPLNPKDVLTVPSFLTSPCKGFRTESLGRSTCGLRRGSSARPTDMTGSSWLSGGTSSNSSQELLSGQSEEKLFPSDSTREQSRYADNSGEGPTNAHEHMEPTEKHVLGLENTEIGMGSLHPESLEQQCKQNVKDGDGLERGDTGTSVGGEVFTVRSKRSALHSRASHWMAGVDLPESDPYKKVYVSGARRRGGMGENQAVFSSKDASSTVLERKPHMASISSIKDHQQKNDDKIDGNFSSTKNFDHLFDSIKTGMLDLESDIPWTCLRKLWKKSQHTWLKTLQDSCTIKDLCTRLQEFHDALLLTAPGGISDEEWNEQLNSALESESIDLLSSLWEKIKEDVSKWMESKPKRSRGLLIIKHESGELVEVQKLFPQLNVGGLSPAGITAATTVAAAEAFAEGQLDTETLLAVPMKLIQNHNYQDLAAVREAIEREKRHLAAKLIQLEEAFCEKDDLDNQVLENGSLIDNPKLLAASPVLLEMEAPSTAVITSDASFSLRDKLVTAPDNGVEEMMNVPVEDGEATDMSDSD